MKKIITILVVLLLTGSLTACSGKWKGMEGDWILSSNLSNLLGKDSDIIKMSTGIFVNIKGKNAELETVGKDSSIKNGKLEDCKNDGNSRSCSYKVENELSSVSNRTITYNLDNPDELVMKFTVSAGSVSTESTQIFKRNESGQHKVDLSERNGSVFLSHTDKDVTDDKAERIYTYSDNDVRIDTYSRYYYYDAYTYFYDSPYIEVNVSGNSNLKYENATATIKVTAEISNPWNSLAEYYWLSSSNAQKKTVSKEFTINLDENGNGKAIVFTDGFSKSLSLYNAVADYEADVEIVSATGYVSIK